MFDLSSKDKLKLTYQTEPWQTAYEEMEQWTSILFLRIRKRRYRR